MHAQNQLGMKEIKDSITGIHRRIDEEFRERRRQQGAE
jgi:hypothetical protein